MVLLKRYSDKKVLYFNSVQYDLIQVCQFLDCSIDDEKMATLVEHLQFSNFKNNPAVNNEGAKVSSMVRQSGGNNFLS